MRDKKCLADYTRTKSLRAKNDLKYYAANNSSSKYLV